MPGALPRASSRAGGCTGGSAPGLPTRDRRRFRARAAIPFETVDDPRPEWRESRSGSHYSCLPGGILVRVRMLHGVKGLKTATGCPPWTPLYRTPCLFPHARPQRGSADDGKRLHALDVASQFASRRAGDSKGRGSGEGEAAGRRLMGGLADSFLVLNKGFPCEAVDSLNKGFPC